jgi:hypothetical protein
MNTAKSKPPSCKTRLKVVDKVYTNNFLWPRKIKRGARYDK